MGSRGCDTDGAAVTAALLEPTPIGESIIGGIILRWALSKAKAPEDGVVVESEKPEDDTVPSETPDDAATPDTPKPTIEKPKTEDDEGNDKKPDYPGNDPTKSPGEGWEWRGKGKPGSDKGSWHNPKTGELLHPDLNHPEGIDPHWDYKGPNGSEGGISPDGEFVPK